MSIKNNNICIIDSRKSDSKVTLKDFVERKNETIINETIIDKPINYNLELIHVRDYFQINNDMIYHSDEKVKSLKRKLP